MFARLHRLITQTSITIELHTAGRFDVLRHVTQDECDFAFYINVLVGVITRTAALRHREAISGKHDFANGLAILAERKRSEFFVEHRFRGRLSFGRNLKSRFLRQHALAGIELEGEKEILAQWLQADLAKIIRDPLRGGLRARSSRHPSIPLRI